MSTENQASSVHLGKLIRFNEFNNGLGVVDVPELEHFVYFLPRHLVGYSGETSREIVRKFRIKPGVGLRVSLSADGSTEFVQALPSFSCQDCGAEIGWIGRFFALIFGKLLHQCPS